MPSLDEIRSITIQTKTEGVGPATDELNKLASAQGNLADAAGKATVVTDTQTRAHLSAQTALDRVRGQIDANFQSQTRLANAQNVLDRAERQSLITTAEHARLLQLANDKYDPAKPSALANALQPLQLQMIALAGGLGPLGVGLAALGGPIGAVTVGVAVLYEGFNRLSNAADELGAKAQGLRTFSVTAGLATEEIQGLRHAASEFGLDSGQVTTFIERFTVQLASLHQATGPLYERLRQINAPLAEQMVLAKGTAAELSLLAQAYQQAGDKGNALLAAAGGRGGMAAAPLIGKIAEAGGVDALVRSLGSAITLTGQEVDELARLKSEADSIGEQNKDLIARWFAQPVLDNQVAARKELHAILQEVQSFSIPSAWDKFVGYIEKIAGFYPGDLSGKTPRVLEQQAAPAAIADHFNHGLGAPAEDPLAAVNKLRATVAAMGQAATAQDKLKIKQDELSIAWHDGVLSLTEYNRAQGLLNETETVTRLNANTAALGAAATPAEHLTDAMGKLRLEYDRGLISRSALTRGLANLNDVEQLAISSGRERLGLITQEELALNAAKEIAKAKADQVIKSAGDETTAQRVLAKSIQDSSDRMKVLGSLTPQLTQLGLDAGNFGKQLDTVATTSLNNLGSGIVDILDKTVDLRTGIQNLEKQFIKSLLNMVTEMLVVAPIARSLSGLLGGFVGGGGAVSGAEWAAAGQGLGPLAPMHGGGIVGDLPGSRYVHPAYFDTAPRFHGGGIAGDEVPIIARKGEEVGWPDQLAAKYGGNSMVLNASITVQVQGGGSASDHAAQGQVIGDAIDSRLRAMMRDEMANQSRMGGILARR